ncbi:hypothetical protein CEXT_720661 [Caerostris extrusa]|uniref:Uncharacterized protein n=1 Tax=Caerostris extrusa TaxID=172846 RepID=A0AAV4R179_CAEEX|nr:hypothetical protein CEXT_720661 [Caerostris extrusa]
MWLLTIGAAMRHREKEDTSSLLLPEIKRNARANWYLITVQHKVESGVMNKESGYEFMNKESGVMNKESGVRDRDNESGVREIESGLSNKDS